VTEADYIDVSNLARLRSVQSAASWLMPVNDAEHGFHTTLFRAIRDWEAQLERRLDGKVK
jgi:hypothetical protein